MTTTTNDLAPHEALAILLRTLKLPTFASSYEEVAQLAERQGWSFGQALRHLCELEIQERRRRRIERLLKASCLPADKTSGTLDRRRLPVKARAQLASLCDGEFISRAENVLVFGLPGVTRRCARVLRHPGTERACRCWRRGSAGIGRPDYLRLGLGKHRCGGR